jgi:tetratricopeptide (TPR) repeat protein
LPGGDRAKLWNAASTLLPLYYNLGTTHFDEELLTEAEQYFKQSGEVADQLKRAQKWKNNYVSIDTLHLNAWMGAGFAASKRKDWKAAETYFQHAQTHFPNHATSLNLLIDAKIELGSFTDAEFLVREAKRRFPQVAAWDFLQMNLYLASKQWEKALAQVDKLIQLEPGNESLYTTKASLLEQELSSIPVNKITASQRDKVDRAYQEATQKFPMSEDAWYSYGTFYYNMYAKLTSLLVKTSEDNPTLDRITADARQILIEKGLPAFKRVQQLNPKDINSLIALSNIYQMQDNTTEFKRVSERLKRLQNGETPSSSLY